MASAPTFLKSNFKKTLKLAWRNFGIRQAVLEHRLQKNLRDWKRLRSAVPVAPTQDSMLLIPSDPYLLTSSVGDQAMIGSILGYWREKLPDHDLFVATASEPADVAARELGGEPLRMMGEALSIPEVAEQIALHQFRVAVLMGADVIDGSYDPSFSGEQVMTLDLAARSGADCYITGSSISKTFHPTLAEIFAEIDPDIRVNLRDPLSKERFEAKSGRDANLVADVAFLLEPDPTQRVQGLLDEIHAEQKKGRSVIAVNVHPLLLELEKREHLPELLDALAKVLIKLAASKDVTYLLLSHDTRGSSSDRLGLEPLYDLLKPELDDRILFPRQQLKAAEIKAVVQELDMVLSGRMHLMIASLGGGTPVFGIDYKDKMEGLLMLLGLKADSLVTAAELIADPDACADQMTHFLEALPKEREKIAAQLDHIHDLSLQNFEDVE